MPAVVFIAANIKYGNKNKSPGEKSDAGCDYCGAGEGEKSGEPG